MMSKILADGPSHDGLFRVSPVKTSFDMARLEINDGTRHDVTNLPVNTVTSLLKVNYVHSDWENLHLYYVLWSMYVFLYSGAQIKDIQPRSVGTPT